MKTPEEWLAELEANLLHGRNVQQQLEDQLQAITEQCLRLEGAINLAQQMITNKEEENGKEWK